MISKMNNKTKFFLIIVTFLFSYSIYANDKFSINQNTLYYDTEIEGLEYPGIGWGKDGLQDVQYLYDVLLEYPEIKTIQLNSGGGDLEIAYAMTDYIIDFELDTHVVGTCESACTLLFIAGANRSVERGSWLGFHQSYFDPEDARWYYENENDYYGWKDEFEYASWLHADTQSEILRDMKFFIEREIDPLFAIKTMTATSDEMWYPRRKELEKANVITVLKE